MAESFFNVVAQESGLSPIFATSTLKRVCIKAGLTPEQLRPEDLTQLLPILEKTLSIYLRPEEVKERLKHLKGLAR